MRYFFGPSQAGRVIAAGGFSPIIVVIASIASVDGVETVTVSVPPHTADPTSPLTKLFVVYAPAQPEASVTPEELINAGFPTGSIEVVEASAGGDLPIPVPSVGPGNYFVQTVLGFDEVVVPPADPAAPAAPADPTTVAAAPTA